MTALALQEVLAEARVPLSALADECGVSRSTLSVLTNHGRWPRRIPELRQRLSECLVRRGLDPAIALRKKKAATRANAPRPVVPAVHTHEQENDTMLLRKQSVTPKARQHFGLTRDPFAECQEPGDVYASPDVRYVRDAMLDKARYGGMLAVIGESGSGKSTLREELIERLTRDDASVIVIQPYVVAMEATDTVGKTLRAMHIGEAIMRAVQPLAQIKSSPEARFAQLHGALQESARSGHRHLLIIEEAHAMPVPTLRHLKRYLELKDGMRPLLSIILIGQPELGLKLSEKDPHVREVVQRCEIATLAPLDDHLGRYLTHRFARIGADRSKILDDAACDAIRAHLATSGRDRGSMLYPLAVHNVAARAINAAAELGAPRVTADIVRESAR